MENPLVSVICLCYNQARFVQEALDSVMTQSYDSIELIIVDDASSDGSQNEIDNWLSKHTGISFLPIKENLGSTVAFNQGLKLATGKYIIDLAADDILLADRIEKQVRFFEKQAKKVGVIYSNGTYISEVGEKLQTHFDKDRLMPYEGNIYENVIDTYFIPTPTMMMRKDVLDELNGYDESLAYEDFDFWVRSSRNWNYAYQPEVLTLIRKSDQSYSTSWYKQGDAQLHSTYLVCEKIRSINKSESEQMALIRRLQFELRQSAFSGNHKEFDCFYHLYKRLKQPSGFYRLLNALNKMKLDLSFVRRVYHKFRFG
ncbi:Glycosyltransferase involved in cell wall bisynthesis [Reichenbachiella faecimaris]|uniref:Glycosyltransferase involved in cell wall bisynthesis n=1 Tax=Reichenbachiella faecimaris TaxID=692418 RepID=A0A1W2GIP1_REIFA|nr:glycosyltransferase [Reichenbachiella faecimaris]SMD36404.1 Glycosyltransferase involved in cell wall bisynthesis [Reichenbachiella faecimaris]